MNNYFKELKIVFFQFLNLTPELFKICFMSGEFAYYFADVMFSIIILLPVTIAIILIVYSLAPVLIPIQAYRKTRWKEDRVWDILKGKD